MESCISPFDSISYFFCNMQAIIFFSCSIFCSCMPAMSFSVVGFLYLCGSFRFVLVPLLWCDRTPKQQQLRVCIGTYIIIMIHIPNLFDHHQRRTSIIVKQINVFFLLHIASSELYCFGRYTSKPIDHVDCWSNWLTVMYSLIFSRILPHHFRWIILSYATIKCYSPIKKMRRVFVL